MRGHWFALQANQWAWRANQWVFTKRKQKKIELVARPAVAAPTHKGWFFAQMHISTCALTADFAVMVVRWGCKDRATCRVTRVLQGFNWREVYLTTTRHTGHNPTYIYLKHVYCRPYQCLCPDACQFYTSLNPCHREHTVWSLGFFSTPKMNVQGFISKHAPLSSSCFKFSSNCNITFSLHKQIPFTLCANFIWMSHLPLPQWYAFTFVVQINKNSWRELWNDMDLRYSLFSH